MRSPREGSPARGKALWAALAVGGLLTGTGCQVEYAGMTLPTGKYMYDDVQYFPPGPDFPWANTQAAQQRARMQAMGMDVSNLPQPGLETAPVVGQPPAAGALEPEQNRMGRPIDANSPLDSAPIPGGPAGGPMPMPGAPAGGPPGGAAPPAAPGMALPGS